MILHDKNKVVREQSVKGVLSGVRITSAELNKADVDALLTLSPTQISDWLVRLSMRYSVVD